MGGWVVSPHLMGAETEAREREQGQGMTEPRPRADSMGWTGAWCSQKAANRAQSRGLGAAEQDSEGECPRLGEGGRSQRL